MAIQLLVLLLLCGGDTTTAGDKAPDHNRGLESHRADRHEPGKVAVENLGRRKLGSDWPGFLGPTGNSKSPERGILTDWPVAGPKKLWERPLGTGYGMPSISQGRLLHFDRQGDQAQLVCLESETGRVLWTFRYQTAYKDLYGYNNGPRCCPVIEGNRVFIYGAEGMLHCLRLEDGQLIWKVDTHERFGVVPNFFWCRCDAGDRWRLIDRAGRWQWP